MVAIDDVNLLRGRVYLRARNINCIAGGRGGPVMKLTASGLREVTVDGVESPTMPTACFSPTPTMRDRGLRQRPQHADGPTAAPVSDRLRPAHAHPRQPRSSTHPAARLTSPCWAPG